MKKYPEGHFIALGIAIGIPMGIPLWVATQNPGLIGAGVAIGVAIGAAMEADAKAKGQIRPLTDRERKDKKLATIVGIGLLLLGLAALVGFYFLR